MYKLLLFAGTTEGRELAEYLAGCKVQVTACVATEYGETLISPQTNLTVHAGRMDRQQMQQLIQQEGFDLVIDATHPYAAVVTQNIAAACAQTDVPLYRCLRESEQGQDELEGYPHLLMAQDTEQAAHLLEEIEGNILLTTGSKELPAYRQVKGFAERFYPRVLPLANVVESCLALGIPAAHLIAMQGPFSQEMNLAMIRQWNISCLVTKESGKTGGVDQKLAAAKQAGISVLLIRRPSEQVAGWSLQALKQELAQRFGIRPVPAAPKPRLHRKLSAVRFAVRQAGAGGRRRTDCSPTRPCAGVLWLSCAGDCAQTEREDGAAAARRRAGRPAAMDLPKLAAGRLYRTGLSAGFGAGSNRRPCGQHRLCRGMSSGRHSGQPLRLPRGM